METIKKHTFEVEVSIGKDGLVDITLESDAGLTVCKKLDHNKLLGALTNIITIELCDVGVVG